MALSQELLDILVCPESKQALVYFADEGFLFCPESRLKYRIEDDIPVMLVDEAELQSRRTELESRGGYEIPAHQTPWQEIQRGLVSQLDTGMVLEPAAAYRRLAQGGVDGTLPLVPRDNH